MFKSKSIFHSLLYILSYTKLFHVSFSSTVNVYETNCLVVCLLSQFKGEITYEVKDMAFCYTIMKVPGDFCSLSAHLTKWLSEVETCKVIDFNVNSLETVSQFHYV